MSISGRRVIPECYLNKVVQLGRNNLLSVWVADKCLLFPHEVDPQRNCRGILQEIILFSNLIFNVGNKLRSYLRASSAYL